ncbi:MAG: TonB-dependent receptor [Labilibaculum sp.]|nr:TonB-dependent receptor [Labilibaculum sp.]
MKTFLPGRWRKILLIMKLTCLFMLLSVFQLTASVSAQNVRMDVDFEDASLSEVFREVRKLSGFNFLYNAEEINSKENVSVEMKNASLEEVLEECIKGRSLKYKIQDSTIVLSTALEVSIQGSNVQEKKIIDGLVSDKDGFPLPGVSVVVKGTTRGVITDVDGKFNLDVVDDNIILVFSFVGMKTQEVSVGELSTLDIVLEQDNVGMEEVVVIGYGQIKKEDATGSVVAIGEKDFNQGTTSSPQDLIMGKVAGVNLVSEGGQPGSDVRIRIRGGSSMSASNDPLIVIDGVPIDNRGIDGMSNILSSINPNDIASFSVLKDASSTAIYGSRASNGVIIINTKRAKKGQKLSVDYSSRFSIGKVVETFDLLSGDEFRQIINSRHASDSDVDMAIRNRLGVENTDWQDEIYQNSFGQDHNVSIAGSVKNIPIRASIGYTDQEGVLKTSEMQRTTYTLNINPSLLDDHLKLNIGLKGMNIENRFADAGSIGAAIRFDPSQPVRSSDPQFDQFGGYYTWMLNGAKNINGTNNPVSMLEQARDKSDVSRIIGDFKLDYKIHGMPELSVNLVAGIDYTKSEGKDVVEDNAAFASNDNSELNRNYNHDLKNELFDFYLNYNKEIESIDSKIEAMVGYEWQHFHSESDQTVMRRNVEDPSKSSDETENYLVSFFGRVNYTFKNKYLLTFTLRRDGSSRFHKDERWGTFPSLAFAWKMKNESFLKNSNLISSLNMRLGYGVTGQQSLSDNDYPYMGTFTKSDEFRRYQFGSDFVYTLRPNGYDKALKWEETTTYNFGLDYGLLNNRIYGSLDVYYKETEDLINTIPVPTGTNFTDLLTTNVGALENKGVEFSINSLLVAKKDFSWDLGLNITYNENEITKLTNYDDPNYRGVETGEISGVGVGNNVQIHSVGHALNTYSVYKQKYDQLGKPIEGDYVDLNNDGEINTSDRYYGDSPDPKVFMGISSSVNYKNWDFSFNGRASFGNDVYNNNALGARYQEMVVNDYLTNLPSSIKYTQFENAQQFSDFFVEDASFFKMDNISLGYSFKNLKLFNSDAHLRVYASVQNAFTITSYDGLDPEITDGIDDNVYPRPRTFLFGVNMKF